MRWLLIASLNNLRATPAPTVRHLPEWRGVSLRPWQSGAIRLIDMRNVGPGITISTPSGKSTDPVTSVVREVELRPVAFERNFFGRPFFLGQDVHFGSSGCAG